jgi:hypothetical protein
MARSSVPGDTIPLQESQTRQTLRVGAFWQTGEPIVDEDHRSPDDRRRGLACPQHAHPPLDLLAGARQALVDLRARQAEVRQQPLVQADGAVERGARVSVDGDEWKARARLADPAERDELWARGLEIYPGWRNYVSRAGDRHIEAFVLVRE